MKRFFISSTTLWGTGIIIAAALFLSLFFVMNTHVDAVKGSGRLLTIHDRGTQNVILTEASTIGEALEEAGVSLDSHDVVEPALTEKMVATEYQINIYRARPVTVIDGVTRQKIITAYQTAEQIIKDVGISLYPEDTTTLRRSDNLLADGAGLELSIDRATPFEFTLYGTTTTARTQAKTVGEMLKEKNVVLGEHDRVSTAASDTITAGKSIRVWREGKQTITVAEPVGFGTQQIKDADREYGYKAIQTVGVEGQQNVTYEVEIRDGVEVGRTRIAHLVTTEPTDQIEVIGTKLPTPTTPTENQVIGHEMMLQAGHDEGQWACLYNLWMRESGWTTTAGNRSSGAYGIPQSLPASKMATVGADYLTNPRTQITWGLNYIKARYGTPCGAWDAFNSRSPHWY